MKLWIIIGLQKTLMGQVVTLFPHNFTLKGLKMVIFSVCSNYVVPGPGQLAFGLNLLTAVKFSLS